MITSPEEPEPRTEEQLLDALLNARVVLWFCPTNHDHRVEWEVTEDHKNIPHCLDCNQVGEPR